MKTKKRQRRKKHTQRFGLGAALFRIGLIMLVLIPFCAPHLFGPKQTTASSLMATEEIARSDFSYILMQPGSTKTFTITFKNSGTKTWYREGSERVAINTTAPIGRRSQFQHSSWSAWWRPAKLPQEKVAPGQSATFSFTLQAPLRRGEYIERFSLAGLPEGEIPNGGFSLIIFVGDSLPLPYFRGQVTGSSATNASMRPGETKTFWIEFENKGRQSWWSGNDPATLETANPRLNESVFANIDWIENTYPAKIQNADVRTGQKTKVFFTMTAPVTTGKYLESFQLVARRLAPIPGAFKTFAITVSGDPIEGKVKGQTIINEPIIRVGVTTLNDGIEVRPTGKHTFVKEDGTKLIVGNGNELSTITYTDGIYTLQTPRKRLTSNQPIRVLPRNDVVTAIVNYRTYYDTFRGIIEIRFTPATNKLWVINELPFEQYLWGLAEAVNGQHPEYMKTLAVAARSYALWHYFVSSRHKNENYHINATTDQLYKGFLYEQKTLDFVAGVKATKGLVMTHPSAAFSKNPNSIALGAYSSGTDGRTRSFTEVFGGKPEDWEWMVSVPDPLGIIPNATTRPGNHMVGMSATGALRYAVREGRSYDWILKHYYTGITLKKFY